MHFAEARRIALALERIADALEKQDKPFDYWSKDIEPKDTIEDVRIRSNRED